ncbi:MAG: hypothetical protein IPM81_12840 [Saprospirales bacterium]|nr:hypothetical protein [Saprospirales bacterium]
MVCKTLEIELHDLLNPVLEEEVELMQNVVDELCYIIEEDARRDLPEILVDEENSAEKEEILAKFELLAELIDSVDSIEDIAARIDVTYLAEKEQYEVNMQAVYAQTKPFEKTARGLQLLYENATGDTNVYLMPVNSGRFADSANPKHFDQFRHYLRQKFYEWFMDDSPFYIAYIGDIGSKSAMDKMAMIAQETCAIAVVDIKEMGSAKAVLEYTKRLKIAGIPPHLAHLVTLGTWLYAHNAFEVDFIRDDNGRLKRQEKPMAVPAAGAFIGKMMSVPAGYYITGLEQSAILGINGVKVAYDLQRIEAKDWDECGVVQIEPYGHIMGTCTANKSNNYDLRKFPKVDTANALLKDLVQFCNTKANSKWGKRQQRDFEKELHIYFGRRMKQDLIEGYRINKIEYDEHEEKVDIDIIIIFAEAADEFDINLHGPKEMIDFKKDETEK